MVNDRLRLIIVGTGGMARLHAQNFTVLPDVKVVGGVDLDADRVMSFCKAHRITRHFTSLEDAIQWGEFEAAANVTPDIVHYPTTMQLIAAGKHVFCEKPLATNADDAAAMTLAAEQADLVGMVNLTYRNMPALQRARELVLAGELGTIRHVEASYLQSWLTSNHWGDWRTTPAWLWRLSRAHGSMGVLGDIGIHILDCASYACASGISDISCRLKTFHKADGDRVGEYVLDANDAFAMTVEFENGALGVIHASRMATGHLDEVRMRIYGDLGALALSVRYDTAALDRVSHLAACLGDDRHSQKWTAVELTPVESNYQRFVRAVGQGETLEPSFSHAAMLQRHLDRCLAAERPSRTPRGN
jgi:predicted dehydrogenase